MEEEMLVIPESILEKLKGGEVTVTFDRSDGMIYIYGDGVLRDSFAAGNDVSETSGAIGPWPNGEYSMRDTCDPTSHSDDGFNSQYGTYGNFNSNNFYDTDTCTTRTDMGLHSGRGDNVDYDTMGCIRTTDAGIAAVIANIGEYGSFTYITVRD